MSKLTKFFNNPIKFFKDTKLLSPFFYRNLSLHELCDFVGKESKPKAVLLHFSHWKREVVQKFLPEYNVGYLKNKYLTRPILQWLVKQDVDIIIWGYKEKASYAPYLTNNKRVARMEDGFLRSNELGSNHALPLSLVLDKKGMYFNSYQESDLEGILNKNNYTISELIQAREAIATIKKNGLSKYNNVKAKNLDDYIGAKKQDRVLVIGQVEDDASIKYGCNKKFTNNDLVRLAREENINAEIIYKIHPDVIANKRNKNSNPDDVADICTILNENFRPKDLFANVDRVYTITSLMGFEALLFGKPVVCVGAPFYSGWGLTEDKQKVLRRKKKLTLEEIFAGSYIKYPRYCTNVSNDISSVIDLLASGLNT